MRNLHFSPHYRYRPFSQYTPCWETGQVLWRGLAVLWNQSLCSGTMAPMNTEEGWVRDNGVHTLQRTGCSQNTMGVCILTVAMAYLVNNFLVEAEWDVGLQWDGHPLEQRAKIDPFVSLPYVFIVAETRAVIVQNEYSTMMNRWHYLYVTCW